MDSLNWPSPSLSELPGYRESIQRKGGKPKIQTASLTKTIPAAQDVQFRLGKPSSVRSYRDCHFFDISGDFVCQYRPEEGVFWQCLSYQEDGSSYPEKKLDIGEPRADLDNVKFIGLNAEGFLLVQVGLKNPPTPAESYRDTVYCLNTGKEVWTRYQPGTGHHQRPFYTPLFVGKERVYFYPRGKPEILMAYELRTGKLVYESDVGFRWIPVNGLGYYTILPSHIIQLISAKNGEFILYTGRHAPYLGPMMEITLIDAANGQSIGKLVVEQESSPSIISDPTANSCTFALISYRRNYPSSYIKIQHFSQNPTDGQFSSTGTEIVCLQDQALLDVLAIDPFRHIIASYSGRPLPYVWPLAECSDPAVYGTVYEDLPGRAVDRYWSLKGMCEITLPPQTKRGKKRRPFIPDNAFSNRLRIADGRVVIWGSLYYANDKKRFYVFDFSHRRRGV
ncbi:hypothetical protein FQN51_005459 [Onygenales sp. PD_10]|nr:hypothetical protein FQN51_005459 [Onygenales sp. PD_10]